LHCRLSLSEEYKATEIVTQVGRVEKRRGKSGRSELPLLFCAGRLLVSRARNPDTKHRGKQDISSVAMTDGNKKLPEGSFLLPSARNRTPRLGPRKTRTSLGTSHTALSLNFNLCVGDAETRNATQRKGGVSVSECPEPRRKTSGQAGRKSNSDGE
jgi:hypothetical protein